MNAKKLTALLISVFMLLQMCVISVSAETDSDTAASDIVTETDESSESGDAAETETSAITAATDRGTVAYVEAETITVDGSKDDAYASVMPIEVKYIDDVPVADLTDGTANVYLMTNNGLLYVYGEINDTNPLTPDAEAQANWPWDTDSLELFIDPNGDGSGNVYQFRIDNSGYPSFYMNWNGVMSAYGPEAAKDYFVSYADGERNGGYTVEFCIDLKNFGVCANTKLGINFQLNDRDADENGEISQRAIYNGIAGSFDSYDYDYVTIGAGETYEAVGEPVPSSGTCGDNLTWTMEDGVLTVSGTGEMYWDPFCSKDAIRSVVIEEGVTTISGYAFYNCQNLTSVTISDTVTVIGDSAFRACPALTQIVIPDSVQTIELYAFQNCPSLESVTIGEAVTFLGDSVFRNCISLKEITIPDSVTTIDIWAFAECPALETLQLGSGLTKISDCAFRDNTSLKSVVIPENVTELGLLAFYNCTSLESVVFKNCNPTIGDWAFEACTVLRYANLGNALTSLGVGMFCSCEQLEAVYFTGAAPTVIGTDAFWNTSANLKLYYYEGTDGWTAPIWVGPNHHGYTTVMLAAGTSIPTETDNRIADLESIPVVDEAAVVCDGVKDSIYSSGTDLLINQRMEGSGMTGAIASASMLTDDGLIYLYVDVIDPQMVEPTPEVQANEPWYTDSVEFLLHTHNNVHQFRVDTTGYLSYYRNVNGIVHAYGAEAEEYFVSHTAVPTDHGYAVEFCIDAKKFAVSSGETIGIQLQLNDLLADGGWSCYHYRATDHAFTTANFDEVLIGEGEDYVGTPLPMLGSNIASVPYIKPDRIIIDGEFSSVWDNAATVAIDQFNYGDENASTRGTAYMYWTDGKWYLFVDVKDADVTEPDPEMQQYAPWQTDSVEMFFDFGHAHSALVKQFRLDCSGYPSYYEENGNAYAYGEDAKNYFDEYAVKIDDDGYNVEMVINLSQWGLNPGDEIGLQLQINDVISSNPTEVYSCWNMHQSMGAGSWDADLYDYVTLEEQEIEEVVETPVEIPAADNTDSVSVKVEDAVLAGDSVTINEVDETAIENAFTDTSAESSNTVTIDVSNVTTEGSDEAETVQQITIPTTVVDTIKESAENNNVEDAKLAVQMSTGSIILDKSTLDLIASKAANAGEGTVTTVSMVIDDADDNLNEVQETALADEIVYGTLNVSMEVATTYADGNTASESIHDFKGGTVQLEVPFEVPEGMEETGFTVYYLDEAGNLVEMDTEYVDGKIVWTTDHFSDYIILYREPTDEPADEPTDTPADEPTDCPIKDIAEEVFDMMNDIHQNIGKDWKAVTQRIYSGIRSLAEKLSALWK